jgi:hypothetical protein
MPHLLICSKPEDKYLKEKVKGQLEQLYDILDCGNSIENMAQSINNYVYIFGIILTDIKSCTSACIELNKSNPNLRAAVVWDVRAILGSDCNVACIPIDNMNHFQISRLIKQITNRYISNKNSLSMSPDMKMRRGLIKVY